MIEKFTTVILNEFKEEIAEGNELPDQKSIRTVWEKKTSYILDC